MTAHEILAALSRAGVHATLSWAWARAHEPAGAARQNQPLSSTPVVDQTRTRNSALLHWLCPCCGSGRLSSRGSRCPCGWSVDAAARAWSPERREAYQARALWLLLDRDDEWARGAYEALRGEG